MTVCARPYLTAGVAAVGASAIAIASSVAPPPDVTVPASQPATTHVVSKATVELLAAIQRMSPRLVISPPTTGAPAAVAAIPQAAAVTSPVPLNAASDVIVTAWNAVLPWIDYGVDLADYALGFIPGLNLIGDQISIVYYSLVRPVANSFVVDLVAPVVNAPLNINSYVNGLITLGSVTVNSLINLGINEFNYFFGWLVPPLPPIPLTAQTATATGASANLLAPAARAVDNVRLAANTLLAEARDVASVPASIKSALRTAGTGTVAGARTDVTEQSASDTPSAEVAKNTDDQQSDAAQEAKGSTSSPRAVRGQSERRRGAETSVTAKVTDGNASDKPAANADDSTKKTDTPTTRTKTKGDKAESHKRAASHS